MKENEGVGAEIEDVRVSLLRPVPKRSCYSHEADKGVLGQREGGETSTILIQPGRVSLNTFWVVSKVELSETWLSRKS